MSFCGECGTHPRNATTPNGDEPKVAAGLLHLAGDILASWLVCLFQHMSTDNKCFVRGRSLERSGRGLRCFSRGRFNHVIANHHSRAIQRVAHHEPSARWGERLLGARRSLDPTLVGVYSTRGLSLFKPWCPEKKAPHNLSCMNYEAEGLLLLRRGSLAGAEAMRSTLSPVMGCMIPSCVLSHSYRMKALVRPNQQEVGAV
jgi:hypothetical protein